MIAPIILVLRLEKLKGDTDEDVPSFVEKIKIKDSDSAIYQDCETRQEGKQMRFSQTDYPACKICQDSSAQNLWESATKV